MPIYNFYLMIFILSIVKVGYLMINLIGINFVGPGLCLFIRIFISISMKLCSLMNQESQLSYHYRLALVFYKINNIFDLSYYKLIFFHN